MDMKLLLLIVLAAVGSVTVYVSVDAEVLHSVLATAASTKCVEVQDEVRKEVQEERSERILVRRENETQLVSLHDGRKPTTEGGENLCVIIRTYPGQKQALPLLMRGFAIDKTFQDGTDTGIINRTTRIVANTGYSKDVTLGDQELVDALQPATALIPAGANINWELLSLGHSFGVPSQDKCGYDVNKHALDGIAAEEQKNETQRCDRHIFTNGDNLCHGGAIHIINKQLQTKDADLVGVQMICHHHGCVCDGPTEFRFARIDLGAVMIKRRVYHDCTVGLPQQRYPAKKGSQKPWHASDW